MNIRELYYKGKARIRYSIYNQNYGKKWYPYLYPSYWHMRLHRRNKKELCENYFAAKPNPGAGIGHQMANWIAGYWFAEQFGLRFAHIPFSTSRIPYTSSSWEEFLGFGKDEVRVEELVKEQGYHLIRLPMFAEEKASDVQMIRDIIQSYGGKKTVFLAEQDQFYRNQYGVMEKIQGKFYNTSIQRGALLYGRMDGIHIAVHVRRGDVVEHSDNPNIAMRWLDPNYYCCILKILLEVLQGKKADIYIFSQGDKKDFEVFSKFPNVHFCTDMEAQETFWHLSQADILLISRSSFSYKAALLSSGIIVAPQHFWHGYPPSERWIIADEQGKISEEDFKNIRIGGENGADKESTKEEMRGDL